jgi:tetratricopeptide (TPR) repeat protein
MALAADLPPQIGEGSTRYATEDLLRRRGELSPPPDIYQLNELNKVLFSDMAIQNDELKKVKYYLVNGEIRLAKVFLKKLTYTPTKLRPVVFRYLATLAFIEGDFEKTYSYLSIPELKEIPHYGKICLLHILSQIVLNKNSELEKSWPRCRMENPDNFLQDKLVWLETLIQLKISPAVGVTRIPFKGIKMAALSVEELKVMLKLALYLNQETLVVTQLAGLNIEQLQDTEVRELAGQIFFRTGELAKSYRFVEDLKSPNSENIKGNLYVLRNKYELAYAQFKLALEQKQNSQNAMERLLPLAWLLGDWAGGAKYAEQVIASPQTQINKMTLLAAFSMQKGDYEGANHIVEAISQLSRRGTEIEVTQIGSFTSLMQNRPDVVRKLASLSCSQYDLINCWVQFQLNQWDSFPISIRREDKIPDKKDWEKLSKDDVNQALKETVFVNQIDIEELDDKLIQLIPKT